MAATPSTTATMNSTETAPYKPDRSRMKKPAAPAPPRSVASSSCSYTGGSGAVPSHGSRGSGVAGLQSLPQQAAPALSSRSLSDDCAIDDLLEGRMDLHLVLPDGREVLVNVERRTPVMDLLVQVATAHKINPSGHLIQAPGERGDLFTCKPNTAIGSLDVNRVLVVPKSLGAAAGHSADLPFRHAASRPGGRTSKQQPFEPTIRLQVRLPRQQLMVLRLPLSTTLEEVRRSACHEKGLDPGGYQLVRPGVLTQPLDPGCSLQEYGVSEVMLLSNRALAANMQNSTADLLSYSMNQENKRAILCLPSHPRSKGQSLTGSSSDGASSRGTSPTRSEPPAALFSRPGPKKRPAPPPPLPASPPPGLVETRTGGVLLVTERTALETKGKREGAPTHSRQSSDSSGYHEASVLSDLPDTPSPEAAAGRPPCVTARRESSPQSLAVAAAVHRSLDGTPVASGRPARPHSVIVEGTNAGKKRKAPLPPPLVLSTKAASETTLAAAPGARTDALEQLSERIRAPAPRLSLSEKGEVSSARGVGRTPSPASFVWDSAGSSAVSPPNRANTKPRPLTPPSRLAEGENEANRTSRTESMTQEEILSHIDITFGAIEDHDSCSVTEHSTGVSESLSWEYAIPEPPSPFRTRVNCTLDNKETDGITVAELEAKGSPSSLSQVSNNQLQADDLEDDGSLVDSGHIENFREELAELDSDTQVISEQSELSNVPTAFTDKKEAKLIVPGAEKNSVTLVSSPSEVVECSTKPVEQVKEEDTAGSESLSSGISSLSPMSAEGQVSPASPLSPQDIGGSTAKVTKTDNLTPLESDKRQSQESLLGNSNLNGISVARATVEVFSGNKSSKIETAGKGTALAEAHVKTTTEIPPAQVKQPVSSDAPSVASARKQPESSDTLSVRPSARTIDKPLSVINDPASEAVPKTSLVRQDLLKMSCFPNASETKGDGPDLAARVTALQENDDESKLGPIEVDNQDTSKNGRDPMPRNRSINYGPVAFSIGSYGSYKTEAVDDIFGGESGKSRYERFKNIKVVGSMSTAPTVESATESGSATEAHPPVNSKVVMSPAINLAKTHKADRTSKDVNPSFTVRIGERKYSGGPGLEHSTKQFASTVDLRQAQSTDALGPPSQDEMEVQFAEEKDNLLSEYAKLQEQFVAWQQQLATNQNLLEDKNIVPSVASTSLASQRVQGGSTTIVNGSHETRTFTLPRTKPARPVSLVQERSLAFQRQSSMDCVAPVVSFSSWKDRKEEHQPVKTAASRLTKQTNVDIVDSARAPSESSGQTSVGRAAPVVVRQDSRTIQQAKKPPGILYAAPTVRGFSQEAIEKLSQEASYTHRQAPLSRAETTPAPPTNPESKPGPVLRKNSSGHANTRPLSTMNTSAYASQASNGAAKDWRCSMPVTLQTEVVRLAKTPSGTPDSSGNNKPSVVQATLKSGVKTNAVKPPVQSKPQSQQQSQPPPQAPTLPTTKMNGHVPKAWANQDAPTKARVNPDASTKALQSVCESGHSRVKPKQDRDERLERSNSCQTGRTVNIQTTSRIPPAVADPRDVLMDEIRNFGGKSSLKKVSTEPAWQLNICGLRSA